MRVGGMTILHSPGLCCGRPSSMAQTRDSHYFPERRASLDRRLGAAAALMFFRLRIGHGNRRMRNGHRRTPRRHYSVSLGQRGSGTLGVGRCGFPLRRDRAFLCERSAAGGVRRVLLESPSRSQVFPPAFLDGHRSRAHRRTPALRSPQLPPSPRPRLLTQPPAVAAARLNRLRYRSRTPDRRCCPRQLGRPDAHRQWRAYPQGLRGHGAAVLRHGRAIRDVRCAERSSGGLPARALLRDRDQPQDARRDSPRRRSCSASTRATPVFATRCFRSPAALIELE